MLQKLYNVSYFEAGRRLRNRSLLCVNEDFEVKPDAKRASQMLQKLYNVSYFVDCRSARIRSILNVCEEFSNEQDAKRASLDNFKVLGRYHLAV